MHTQDNPMILLDAKKIQSHTRYQPTLTIFETIGSTNDYLLQLNEPAGAINICLAEEQVQGKATRGKTWYSAFAENLYFSCRYPLIAPINDYSSLSLVVSLAVVRTLKRYPVPQPFWVKWPNDVLYDHQKISGNLIEVQRQSQHVVIGIGINVNMLHDLDAITQPWTSLRQITGVYLDRNVLCGSLINHLLDYLYIYSEKGLEAFMAEWQAQDYLQGKDIALLHNGKTIEGCVMGIDGLGRLVLAVDGEVKRFPSGESRVLKNPTGFYPLTDSASR